jgi:hypothetical protein
MESESLIIFGKARKAEENEAAGTECKKYEITLDLDRNIDNGNDGGVI